jgi:hypothetical protein
LGGDRAGEKGVCGRFMSPAWETQSMREIRLLRGRLLRKGGGLTGMQLITHIWALLHKQCNFFKFISQMVIITFIEDKTYILWYHLTIIWLKVVYAETKEKSVGSLTIKGKLFIIRQIIPNLCDKEIVDYIKIK